MNFQVMHKQRKFILIAAVVGLIAIFLPWRTISAGLFGAEMSEGINGFRGAGILAFFSFAIAGILALTGDQAKGLPKNSWLATIGAGLVSLICAIVNIVNANSNSFGIMEFGIGIGCWIALAASIVIAGAAWIFRSPGQNLNDSFDALKKNLSTINTSAGSAGASLENKGVNKIEELEKLIKLKDAGHITETEYQQMKSKLL